MNVRRCLWWLPVTLFAVTVTFAVSLAGVPVAAQTVQAQVHGEPKRHILRFAQVSSNVGNQTCLTCHNRGDSCFGLQEPSFLSFGGSAEARLRSGFSDGSTTVTSLRFGRTEVRASYDFSVTEGSTVDPGAVDGVVPPRFGAATPEVFLRRRLP